MELDLQGNKVIIKRKMFMRSFYWNVFLIDKKGLPRKKDYPSLDDTSS